ncbi:MAG: ABC transporter ATP-binding protein [Bdellovibrionia bacterium]
MKSRSKFIKFIFINKSLIYLITAVLLQQTIVALSTYFISSAVRSAEIPNLFLKFLLLYMASLILPYFPGGLSLVFLKKWTLLAQNNFMSLVKENLYSRPSYWTDSEIRSTKSAIFSKEAPALIEELGNYGYRLTVLCLNAVLSVIAVSLFIDYFFIFTYLFSIALSWLLVRSQEIRSFKLSESAQAAEVDLTDQRFKMWDNLILGNIYSKLIWSRELESRFNAATIQALTVAKFKQLSSISIALVALVPTLVVALFQCFRHSDDPKYLLTLLISFPRVFQLLNSSYELLCMVLEWSSHRGRLSKILSIFEFHTVELKNRIKFKELKFSSKSNHFEVENTGEVIELLNKNKALTLRGRNGSGKSSLCLSVKELLGDKCYLLPAHHNLSLSSSSLPGSTGQKLVTIIKELVNSNCDILILDEWDANLDSENQKFCRDLIEKAVKSGKLVLDVSNR